MTAVELATGLAGTIYIKIILFINILIQIISNK